MKKKMEVGYFIDRGSSSNRKPGADCPIRESSLIAVDPKFTVYDGRGDGCVPFFDDLLSGPSPSVSSSTAGQAAVSSSSSITVSRTSSSSSFECDSDTSPMPDGAFYSPPRKGFDEGYNLLQRKLRMRPKGKGDTDKEAPFVYGTVEEFYSGQYKISYHEDPSLNSFSYPRRCNPNPTLYPPRVMLSNYYWEILMSLPTPRNSVRSSIQDATEFADSSKNSDLAFYLRMLRRRVKERVHVCFGEVLYVFEGEEGMCKMVRFKVGFLAQHGSCAAASSLSFASLTPANYQKIATRGSHPDP